jgi:hypothetical protein
MVPFEFEPSVVQPVIIALLDDKAFELIFFKQQGVIIARCNMG